MSRILDISIPLGAGHIDYPGDPVFAREVVMDTGSGAPCTLSRLAMSAHAGTHLDAPAHFIPGGVPLDHYPLERFILPAQVIGIQHPDAVGREELERLEIASGHALLFRTRNSTSGQCRAGRFREDYVALTPEAAQFCLERQAPLVGIDALSIDLYTAPGFPVHHLLLGQGILVLEGLDLGGAAPGFHTLICLPLAIAGGEAAPVRAVLMARAPLDEPWPRHDPP